MVRFLIQNIDGINNTPTITPLIAGVFIFQSSWIVSAQPVVDQSHDQPHKERSEDISDQLAQGASPPL